MQRLLVVLAGGAAGSAARVGAAAALGWEPGGWPLSSLAVNLTGAAAIGWFLARHARSGSPWWSLDFWAIGVLGSLTTFSALSVETVTLVEAGRAAVAAAYAVASAVAGVAAAGAGHRVGAGA
ncbi:MAG: CrcB family protein [Actinobacteria bacterium]|nr:CrcB family protein [Actinomycetota bacterium]